MHSHAPAGWHIPERPCWTAETAESSGSLRTVLPSASLTWSPQAVPAGTETAVIGLIRTKLRFIVYDEQLVRSGLISERPTRRDVVGGSAILST